MPSSVISSITETSLVHILDALKTLNHSELLKLIKAAATETEKRSKGGKITKTKIKKEPGVKRAVPNQLKKNHAWIAHTLAHAIDNGWESFTIRQSKKNKITGEKEEEEIEMSAAIQNESGAWVYDDSVTEKNPTGKQINHKEAMSLSKLRKELKHETWIEFDTSYTPEEISETASETSESSKVIKKMTAAEKEAEKEIKKAEKEAEKTAKKAEKEAKKVVKKAPVKVDTKKVAEPPKTVAEPPKTTIKPDVKITAKKVVEEWNAPSSGAVKPWTYKGKNYLRGSENELWLKASDGSVGDWVGVYLSAEERIDDSAEEPEYE